MSSIKKILQTIIMVAIWGTVSASIFSFEEDTVKKDTIGIDSYTSNEPAWQQIVYLENKNYEINTNIATQNDSIILIQKGKEKDIQNSDLRIKEDVGLEEWKVKFYYKDILAEKGPAISRYKK